MSRRARLFGVLILAFAAGVGLFNAISLTGVGQQQRRAEGSEEEEALLSPSHDEEEEMEMEQLPEGEVEEEEEEDMGMIGKDVSAAVVARLAMQQVDWDLVADDWKVANVMARREQQQQRRRLFVYQPSGGWGNQRYILKWAIIAANAMDRTLVLAPIAPHSDIWHRFNEFTSKQIISMAQVLDLEALEQAVPRGVLAHNDTILSLKEKYLAHLKWMEYVKPHYNKKQKLWWFPESYIRENFGPGSEYESADVVFWKQGSMWCCCGTDFHLDSNWYGKHIMFNKHLKALAIHLMRSFGSYNAIHVRLGDHAQKDRKNAEVYYKVHKLDRFNTSLPLYIATDERNPDVWFQPLRDKFKFTKLLFWRDLDRKILEREVMAYPFDMHGDILGFIEQLICGNALRWEGSRKSTFSAAIASIRATPALRLLDWSLPPKPSSLLKKTKLASTV